MISQLCLSLIRWHHCVSALAIPLVFVWLCCCIAVVLLLSRSCFICSKCSILLLEPIEHHRSLLGCISLLRTFFVLLLFYSSHCTVLLSISNSYFKFYCLKLNHNLFVHISSILTRFTEMLVCSST